MKFGLMTLFDHYAEDCSEEQYYKNFFDEVSYAEELGFDTIWIGEHHFCRYICPAPQIIAGAIAQRTKRMRIGTGIVLLPHHDPIRLAEDYALVDLISGGRLDLGVGRGFIKATYDGFNQSMDESRERFNECLDIIEGSWAKPNFSYQGKFYKANNITILPRPLQKPAPPIFMAALASEESFVAAGKRGHSLMLAPFFQSRDRLKDNVTLYKETLRNSGFPFEHPEIVSGYHSFIDETAAGARTKWEDHYMRYLHFVNTLINPSEYTSQDYRTWRRSAEALGQVTFEQMYPDQVLCGDVGQAVDRVGLMQEQYGVTHFYTYMDLGGLPQKDLRPSMERFATKVIPQFRE
ncbi:MAG TPA: LLM class flavin-dependent oxidoreductase [Candidatus Binataceae bacterium]|nr:LLM class flavin-dependent oxidoreductase [Candidatus Binataceae bacterium]